MKMKDVASKPGRYCLIATLVKMSVMVLISPLQCLIVCPCLWYGRLFLTKALQSQKSMWHYSSI